MHSKLKSRNELNAKLSEIKVFLKERAKEFAKKEQSCDEVMERIENDLGEKLDQSRNELSRIKEQKEETERGIKQLQSQLRNRA